MKTDKGSLRVQGQSLRIRTANLLQDFTEEVFLSLQTTEAGSARQEGWSQSHFLFDQPPSLGPASALLAASKKNPFASWLTMACDFPLAEKGAVAQLKDCFLSHPSTTAAVTCFQNAEAFPEPLFAIWNSQALELLALHVARGKTGPLFTLQQCEVHLVQPEKSEWLMNANTPEQWRQIVKGSCRKE